MRAQAESLRPARVISPDGLHYRQPVPPPAPLLIIHGQKDNVVPIELSRTYVADYPNLVQLIEVDAGHRLNDQLGFIWEHVQSFLLT